MLVLLERVQMAQLVQVLIGIYAGSVAVVAGFVFWLVTQIKTGKLTHSREREDSRSIQLMAHRMDLVHTSRREVFMLYSRALLPVANTVFSLILFMELGGYAKNRIWSGSKQTIGKWLDTPIRHTNKQTADNPKFNWKSLACAFGMHSWETNHSLNILVHPKLKEISKGTVGDWETRTCTCCGKQQGFWDERQQWTDLGYLTTSGADKGRWLPYGLPASELDMARQIGKHNNLV